MCRTMSTLISSASTLRDDLERRVVRVAPALDEPGLEPRPLHGERDRLAAAVDHDRAHPHGLHEDDVDQQGPQRLGVLHHRAAELDDREAALELADIAERLDQHIRLADRYLVHVASPTPAPAPSSGIQPLSFSPGPPL